MADSWNVVTGVCLGDDAWLEIDEIAVACQVEPHFVELLIDEARPIAVGISYIRSGLSR